MLFRPRPDHAIGNLSLCLATHFINSGGMGRFHKDVYLYGRDQMFVFKHVVSDDDDLEVKDMSVINAFNHLRYKNLGEVMRYLIQPSPRMQSRIDKAWEKISGCTACFHIRRGTNSEDSSRFAYFPTASDQAVDAMVAQALKMDEPVFVLSDSVATKEHFLERVPKAVALDHAIGFTACEHSQNSEVEDEAFEAKMNSVMEWFLISKFSNVYTTMGGVEGVNVPEGTPEGISSTFGYSATVYGGHLPTYVYNDGTFFYPDNPQRGWSDPDTGNYIVVHEPTKEKIEWCTKNFGMWKILVDPTECEQAGIMEWCEERIHVRFMKRGEIRVRKLKELTYAVKDVRRD